MKTTGFIIIYLWVGFSDFYAEYKSDTSLFYLTAVQEPLQITKSGNEFNTGIPDLDISNLIFTRRVESGNNTGCSS